MKLLTALFFTLALSATTSVTANAQAPQPVSEPLQLVRSFYVPGFNSEKMPLSKRLAGLLAAADATSKKINGPVEGLDFAWNMGAQDGPEGWEKTARFTELNRDANKATVRVQFKTDRAMEIHYSLLRESGKWVVDDIAGKGAGQYDKWQLSAMLARGAKEK